MQDNEEILINESDALIEYLKTHPLISLNALEKKLNIPQSTLSKAVKGHKSRSIPVGYWYALSLELRDYGYHIENYITITIEDEERI